VIQLVTLGSLGLTADSSSVLVGRRKVLALLAYMARRAPQPIDRVELTQLLWGDRDAVHAKQSLRQALAELRAVLEGTLETTNDTVRLESGAVVVDADRFEEDVQFERWVEAAQLWKGDFLPSTDTLGGEAWQAWLGAQRESLRPKAALAFEMLSAISTRTGEWPATVDWATRWCDVAPLDEKAFSRRIDALVHTGRPVDASVCYESFVRRLKTVGNSDPRALSPRRHLS
jgi:DNA-binding SARP family transcriptional activator